jgi:hypothetical protein
MILMKHASQFTVVSVELIVIIIIEKEENKLCEIGPFQPLFGMKSM